jgi:hypothetical protein
MPTEKASADTGEANDSDSPTAFAKTHSKISFGSMTQRISKRSNYAPKTE